ncbi:MAG: hypothetical protein IPN71_16210 [Fibrobacteres bacterium]|nr:hypothetical protein [Fibrobacterota bacterium]
MIHSNLTRLADSSLALELLLVRASDDSVLDSTRVGSIPRRLAQRAMAALLAPLDLSVKSPVGSPQHLVAMFRPDSVKRAISRCFRGRCRKNLAKTG